METLFYIAISFAIISIIAGCAAFISFPRGPWG